MPEADIFDRTRFLGLARTSKRDPYRLSLFARHLEQDESPLILVTVRAGTLVVTNRRIIEFRAHLETHGAWNVKTFLGYEIHRRLERGSAKDVMRDVRPAADGRGGIEERIVIRTTEEPETFLVAKGPVTTLTDEEFGTLREAILGPHAK